MLFHHKKGLVAGVVAFACGACACAQSVRVYIAQDDHTDLFWSGTESQYEQSIPDTLDQQLDLIDATINNPPDFQNRWNCDGSWWMWLYEHNRSAADFDRFMARVADGHISVPLNGLAVCLGGTPTEAVLRGSYYPGRIEREYGVRFNLAYLIENQSHPMGIHSLWAGSGAKYSWKGVCGCATLVPQLWDREHEIYHAAGPDGQSVLMKWHSAITTNEGIGGYAEARDPFGVISFVTTQAGSNGFADRYPFDVIGAFGHGWDDFQTPSDDDFVQAAIIKSNASRAVIVSNETDFFEDFLDTYGQAAVPTEARSYGNEWELHSASLAGVTARIRRAVEKLRAAEAMAALAVQHNPAFMDGRNAARDQAWMNLGLFWEHDFGMDGFPAGDPTLAARIAWQRRLADEIDAYVNTLHDDARTAIGLLIDAQGSAARFVAFNPLGWARTDFCDLPWASTDPVHVVEIATGVEIPSEFVRVNARQYLRILATDISSLGYKAYEVRTGAGQAFPVTAISWPAPDGSRVIINNQYSLRVESNGSISSLVNLTQGGTEFAATHNGRVINDLGQAAGTLTLEHIGPVSATIVADVPAPLAHTTRITIYRAIDRIDIHNEITQNFDATHTWSFAFDLDNPTAHHEEVGAILTAKLTTHGGDYAPRNARYDWLSLNHFADIASATGPGITLSNADCSFFQLGDSTPSSLDESTPALSVLAGGKVVHAGGGLPAQGGDTHFTQRFALRAHDGYNQPAAMRFSLEHQNPLVAVVAAGDASDPLPPDSYSFASLSSPDTLLWALKPAEEGSSAGLVARIWNLSNTPESTTLSFNQPVASATETTHIETDLSTLPTIQGELPLSFARQQMRTSRVTFACLADLTGDGIVDAGDLGAFITAYLNEDLAVDFTGDGVVDAGDLGAFIAAFLSGCVS